MYSFGQVTYIEMVGTFKESFVKKTELFDSWNQQGQLLARRSDDVFLTNETFLKTDLDS